MPHGQKEEETESHIFDKVAKDSSDSTASEHPLHDENKQPVKASQADHQSKGPVIPDNMPEAASKDEIKARAAELNK